MPNVIESKTIKYGIAQQEILQLYARRRNK